MKSWRGLVFVSLLGLFAVAGCGSGQAPCGEQWCADNEVCCITPPNTYQCVSGDSCPSK